MAKSTKSYEARMLEMEKKEQESLEKAKRYAAQKKELLKRKKAEEDTTTLIPLDVIYSNNRPSLFDNDGLTNSDTTGTNACLVKAKVWEYEQEVRVIKKK